MRYNAAYVKGDFAHAVALSRHNLAMSRYRRSQIERRRIPFSDFLSSSLRIPRAQNRAGWPRMWRSFWRAILHTLRRCFDFLRRRGPSLRLEAGGFHDPRPALRLLQDACQEFGAAQAGHIEALRFELGAHLR